MPTLNEFLEKALDDKTKVDEVYVAGKGGKDVAQLINTVKGFSDDIYQMVEFGNHKGAMDTLKVLKTKVLSDLEKAIKKLG